VRCTTKDVVLGGYAIKAGSFVLPSPYSTQRHPDYWPRPDEWLPERWLPQNAKELAPHADKAWCVRAVCRGRRLTQLPALCSRPSATARAKLPRVIPPTAPARGPLGGPRDATVWRNEHLLP
jgi:cytochrome P450